MHDEEKKNEDNEEDYVYISSEVHLWKCADNIVVYITEYISHKLITSLRCEQCTEALSMDCIKVNLFLALIQIGINEGNFACPSDDIINITLFQKEHFSWEKHRTLWGERVSASLLHRNSAPTTNHFPLFPNSYSIQNQFKIIFTF